MIDMDAVTDILDVDVKNLISSLHGTIDTDLPVEKAEKDAVRSYKAQVSRDLLMLADRLELCKVLVKNEYWRYKGQSLDMVVDL